MDVLSSCDWCGRVEAEVENYGEAGSCFWRNDGLTLEVVIGWGKGKWGADLVEGIGWGVGEQGVGIGLE